MSVIIHAVAVLIFDEGKVLLVRHEVGAGHLSGVYGLPAGKIHDGESEISAAIRELQEETGLTTTPESLVEFTDNEYTGTFPRKDGAELTSTMKVFICQHYTGKLKGSIETTPVWVDIKKIHKYNLLPNVAKAVQDAFDVTR